MHVDFSISWDVTSYSINYKVIMMIHWLLQLLEAMNSGDLFLWLVDMNIREHPYTGPKQERK